MAKTMSYYPTITAMVICFVFGVPNGVHAQENCADKIIKGGKGLEVIDCLKKIEQRVVSLEKHYKPIKAWVIFDSESAAVQGKFNVASVTPTEVADGQYKVVWNEPFKDSNYIVLCNADHLTCSVYNQSLESVMIRTFNHEGIGLEQRDVSLIAFQHSPN